MPQLNGYETIKILRATERYCHIPVIFLSAMAIKEDIQTAYKLGCKVYITKPFNGDDLKLNIYQLLKKSIIDQSSQVSKIAVRSG